jgi:hypothetical protein
MRKFFFLLLAVLTLGLLLLAAPAEGQQKTPATPVNTGSLRVIHAMLGFGPVDVYVDGERLILGLAARQATPYLRLPAGKHDVAVRPANAEALTPPLTSYLLDMAANESYSAVAYHKKFAPDNAQAYSGDQSGAMFIIHDDRSPLTLGNTRLTAVNLAVGAPANLTVGYPSRAALLYNVGFEKPFGTIDVPAGTYPMVVLNADSPDNAILERTGDQIFYANTLYTLIIVPRLQAGRAYTLPSETATPTMFAVAAPLETPASGIRVRIVHAAYSTAVVDVYIDNQLVAQRLNYKRVTEYLGMQDYSHTITLRAFGSSPTSTPLAQAKFEITAENRNQVNWTLLLLNSSPEQQPPAALTLTLTPPGQPPTATPSPVLINTPNGSMVMALVPDNISQTVPNTARVRVINAAANISQVGAYTPAFPLPKPPVGTTPTPAPTVNPAAPLPPPQTLVPPVSFGAEASEKEVPVGLYKQINFIPANSGTPLVSLPNVQFIDGMVYTYIIVGSPGGDQPVEAIALQDFGSGLPSRRLYIGRVLQQGLQLRSNPAFNASRVASLPKDSEVEVLGRTTNNTWVRVRFTNPDTGEVLDGWISSPGSSLKITRLAVPVSVNALPIYAPTPATGGG